MLLDLQQYFLPFFVVFFLFIQRNNPLKLLIYRSPSWFLLFKPVCAPRPDHPEPRRKFESCVLQWAQLSGSAEGARVSALLSVGSLSCFNEALDLHRRSSSPWVTQRKVGWRSAKSSAEQGSRCAPKHHKSAADSSSACQDSLMFPRCRNPAGGGIGMCEAGNPDSSWNLCGSEVGGLIKLFL